MVVEGHGFVGDAEFGRRVNGELDGERMIVGWHRGGWRVDAEIGLCVDIVVVGVCRASADRWLRVVVSGCNGRVVDYGVIFGQCREDYVFWWWWGAGVEAGVDWCGFAEDGDVVIDVVIIIVLVLSGEGHCVRCHRRCSWRVGGR